MKTRVVGPVGSEIAGGFESALESFEADDVVQTAFHSMAATQINGSAGAFVELGAAGALPAAVKRIRLAYTSGEPLQFRTGADAAAAAAGSDLFIVNQGEDSFDIPCQIALGEKIWVKSLSANAVTGGYITANFLG